MVEARDRDRYPLRSLEGERFQARSLCQEDRLINRFTLSGTIAVGVAAAMLLMSSLSASPARAGENCTIGEPVEPSGITALQELPTCTPTVGIIKSATPTSTATPEATETELTEPSATVAPSTPVPPAATATKAGGGVGAGIQGPNTGTGDGGSGGGLTLWVTGAVALIVIGGGSVAYGLRRRSS